MTETETIKEKGDAYELCLKVVNLTKKFGELIAVNQANFEVKKGEILGIIGPNGSGKTTIFNLLSGVLKPDGGAIYAKRVRRDLSPLSQIIKKLKRLLNRDNTYLETEEATEFENIAGLRTDKIVNQFGLVRTFQIVKPFKLLTAENNLIVPYVPKQPISKPSSIKNAAVSSLLAVDLGEKKNYPAFILPHGDLKRLDIARSMACDPQILLLDEPFSGLSAEDSFRVTQLIKNANEEFGLSIILVEHKLKLLSNLVSRIIVLDQGSVIAIGTPEEISKNALVISSYLGKEASLIVKS